MSTNDALGTRMKENYEMRARTYLTRRTPAAIRIDGKAFHGFTQGFKKPFDRVLMQSMQETMKYLCENVQGCILGYTQSDEITLILQDYKEINTAAWFDYQVQKICSISASMATMAFNKAFSEKAGQWLANYYEAWNTSSEERKLAEAYEKALNKGAMFDARCFNIPKEEIINLIYWRQQDASKNSVQMVARTYFSDKQLHKKNTSEMQEMLFSEKGINWNDFPVDCKRGSCCIKETYAMTKDGGTVTTDNYEFEDVVWRSRWVIDRNIPIFRDTGRHYIEKILQF